MKEKNTIVMKRLRKEEEEIEKILLKKSIKNHQNMIAEKELEENPLLQEEMMKKKEQNSMLYIIIGALLVLLLVRYPNILHSNSNNNFENVNTDQIMNEDRLCNEYNIFNQFSNVMGARNVLALQAMCEKIYPEGYTAEANEYSCYTDGAEYSFVCPGSDEWNALPSNHNWRIFVNAFKSECDSLNANFICRDDYFGCLCNKAPPAEWQYPDTTQGKTKCEDVELPQYGDLGGICRDNGYCANSEYTCDSYWDYLLQTHKCGCTELPYCGQLCYEYAKDNCKCPPDTYILVSDTTIKCVPTGCECVDSEVNCE